MFLEVDDFDDNDDAVVVAAAVNDKRDTFVFDIVTFPHKTEVNVHCLLIHKLQGATVTTGWAKKPGNIFLTNIYRHKIRWKGYCFITIFFLYLSWMPHYTCEAQQVIKKEKN